MSKNNNTTSIWKLTAAFLAGVSSVFIFKEVSKRKEVKEALEKTKAAFQKGASNANKAMKEAFDPNALRKFQKDLKGKLNALKKLIAHHEGEQGKGVKSGQSLVKEAKAIEENKTKS